MEQIIIVKPNQSLSDVILQGCGSMEAGMQMMADNGMALSDIPIVGSAVIVSANALALGESGSLQYLAQNAIVIGTLGNVNVDSILITEDGDDPLVTEDGGSVLIAE